MAEAQTAAPRHRRPKYRPRVLAAKSGDDEKIGDGHFNAWRIKAQYAVAHNPRPYRAVVLPPVVHQGQPFRVDD